MQPSALGRQIRLLEEDLRARLLTRTTREVSLTEAGAALLRESRPLLAQADELCMRFRDQGRGKATTLKVGAIDTASAGLMPALFYDFRELRPDVSVQLLEEKTIRLLPRLLSGRIDVAFVRPPPERSDPSIEFFMLVHETAVVAVPAGHPLARRKQLSVDTLEGQPLIVPDRRSRPHSHDLTIKLFEQAGLRPTIAQVAEEKQTIINFVAAGHGLAIVPRWTSRLSTPGIRYIRLNTRRVLELNMLPLAAAWMRGTRDPARGELLALLQSRLREYTLKA
jgi:DNA-binding transcriptional LysR family regulator